MCPFIDPKPRRVSRRHCVGSPRIARGNSFPPLAVSPARVSESYPCAAAIGGASTCSAWGIRGSPRYRALCFQIEPPVETNAFFDRIGLARTPTSTLEAILELPNPIRCDPNMGLGSLLPPPGKHPLGTRGRLGLELESRPWLAVRPGLAAVPAFDRSVCIRCGATGTSAHGGGTLAPIRHRDERLGEDLRSGDRLFEQLGVASGPAFPGAPSVVVVNRCYLCLNSDYLLN